MKEEIICVLDKSGSMQSVAGDAVGGFNKFIDDQKKINDANFTLVWFDHDFKVGYEGKLSEFKPLKEWPWGGTTSLHDAIGKTFNHVKERFSKEKPEKVILAILTDGFENSSKEFTSSSVKSLVEEHQNKYNWDVIYIAADQDAWDVAQHFGVQQCNAVSYSSANTRGGFAKYTNSVTKSRL